MDLRVDFKNPTKDSNSDIVTLECHISAYWANGDKVYDESFSWNPPFDKRMPFSRFPLPNVSSRRQMSEDQLNEQLKFDDIYYEWFTLIQPNQEYQSHITQAQSQLDLDPREDDPQEGPIVPAKE